MSGGQKLALLSVLAAVVSVGIVPAQDRDREDEQLKPQAVEFSTTDGVRIAAVYYPSKLGKEAAPVLLLHDYGGKYGDWAPLIPTLREADFAVMIIDFRGHGFSTKYDPSIVPEPLQRRLGPLTPQAFRSAADFRKMLLDVEAAKRFLLQKNDEGELNISKLSVVGAGFGAVIGGIWSLADWSQPQTGLVRTGRDVQALVMLSPVMNFRGLRLDTPIRRLQLVLPIMIAYGRQNKEYAQQAERLWRLIRKTTPGGQQSVLLPLDTKLQGTHLLNPELGFDLDKRIAQFLQIRVRNLIGPDYEWQKRLE